MKTKILSMLLVLTLLLGVVAVLSSCGGECKHENIESVQWESAGNAMHRRKCPDCDFVATEAHKMAPDPERYDPYAETIIEICSKCDYSKEVPNTIDGFDLELAEKSGSYPWETTDLLMSVCDSSNSNELESGGRAYVSGEWDPEGDDFEASNTVSKVDKAVLDSVRARNENSLSKAKVNLTYTYLGAAYGWGAVVGQIGIENTANTTPDLYYNFIYDMVGASINGYFKNIQGNEYLAPFYAQFTDGTDAAGLPTTPEDTRGFNWDYMKDLSFSTKAMYLIASDYSFDISRAYFIMPVSGTLLQSVTEITGDVNEDGTVGDTADFLAMVNNGDWTWAKIAEYTDAVKTGDSGSGGYSLTGGNNDCVAGFAMSTSSGLSSTAIMYTGDLSVVSREVVEGEYRYSYASSTPTSLQSIFKAAKDYIGVPGAGTSADTPDSGEGVILYYGSTSLVDAVFAADRLFVNTACVLGVIESETYQNMWDSSKGSGNGFVVTPAAKVSETQENYRTLVHNIGKVFAISSKVTDTEADAACAFINHQTLDSSTILREYFVWSLGYGAANNDDNVNILASMSNNLKYGIDKVVEDAIGLVHAKDTITDPFNADNTIVAGNVRWHTYMLTHWDLGEGVTTLYDGVWKWKMKSIANIQKDFLKNIEG